MKVCYKLISVQFTARSAGVFNPHHHNKDKLIPSYIKSTEMQINKDKLILSCIKPTRETYTTEIRETNKDKPIQSQCIRQGQYNNKDYKYSGKIKRQQ